MNRADLPATFWEERRRARNKRRKERHRQNQKIRNEEKRAGWEAETAHLDSAEKQRLYDEERAARVARHLEQQAKVKAALETGIPVCVECSFDEANRVPREMRSLSKQLEFCMVANRRAAVPVQLHFTGFRGELKRDTIEVHRAEGWDVIMEERPAPQVDTFRGKRIVVLSPDAEDPLDRVEEGCVYVIGGLVDRTVKKGTSMGFAESNNVVARRLPVQEAGVAEGRGVVLNINHVLEALLGRLAGEEWGEVLARVVPGRKTRVESDRKKRRREKGKGREKGGSSELS